MKLPKSDAAKQRAARLCFVMGGCSVWAHSLAPALPWCRVPVCWDSQPSYLSAFCGLNLTKQLVYKLLGCAESLSCSVGLLASVRANRLRAFHRSVLTVSWSTSSPRVWAWPAWSDSSVWLHTNGCCIISSSAQPRLQDAVLGRKVAASLPIASRNWFRLRKYLKKNPRVSLLFSESFFILFQLSLDKGRGKKINHREMVSTSLTLFNKKIWTCVELRS